MASTSPPERRVAFITGATRGIGLACAEAFAASGHAVALSGREDRARVEERARALAEKHGVPTLAIVADVGNPAAVRESYQAIFRQWKRLDVLVNNAGMLGDAVIGMIGDDMARRVIEVNALGALHNLQAAARLMARGGRGAIVNLSSIMGLRGSAGSAAYAAAKAAILGLTLSAAKELGPKGIRVNAVAPGMIATDMTAGLDRAILDARVAAIPLGRIGTAAEVAEAVHFLASDQASYINGQVLGVDGGMVF